MLSLRKECSSTKTKLFPISSLIHETVSALLSMFLLPNFNINLVVPSVIAKEQGNKVKLLYLNDLTEGNANLELLSLSGFDCNTARQLPSFEVLVPPTSSNCHYGLRGRIHVFFLYILFSFRTALHNLCIK